MQKIKVHKFSILFVVIALIFGQFVLADSSITHTSTDLTSELADEPILRFRYPAISPDGKLVAFTAHGSLWVAGLKSSFLRRVTSYSAREVMPIWLPNSQELLYAADYAGNYDVYRISIKGGTPKQLTSYETSELPYSVSPDGREFYFYGTREGRSDIFVTDSFNMRTPVQLLRTERISEYHPEISLCGNYIAFVTNGNPHAYRRPAYWNYGNSEIWIAQIKDLELTNFRRLTDNLYEDVNPKFVWHPVKERSVLFYSSYPSEKGDVILDNGIFLMDPLNPMNNSAEIQSSKLIIPSPNKQFPLRSSSVVLKDDLWHLVVENGLGGINYYIINPETEQIESSQTLEIDIPLIEENFLTQRTVTRDTIQEYVISPDNKKIAVVHNGDIFISSIDGGITEQLTFTDAKEFHLCWSLDSQTIYYVTLENQKADIYSVDITSGKIQPIINTSSQELMPGITPDGTHLIYIRDDKELRKYNIETKQDDLIFGGGILERQGLSAIPRYQISGSGKFILFLPKLTNDLTGNIWVASLDGKIEPMKITHFSSNCIYPHWSFDDKNIIFSAYVDNDWDMYTLNFEERVQKFTEDELDELLGRDIKPSTLDDARKKEEPEPQTQPAQTQPEQTQPEQTQPAQTQPAQTQPTQTQPTQTTELTDEEVEFWTKAFKNAWDNILQLTTAPTHEYYPFVVGEGEDKKVIYFCSDGNQFWSVSVFGGRQNRLAVSGEPKELLKLAPDRKSINYLSSGKIFKYDIARNSYSSITLTFDYEKNPVTQRISIYDECIWVLRNYYYSDKKIENWLPAAALYRQMILGNSYEGEVSNIYFDLLGALNSSHTGWTPAKSLPNTVNTGALGIFFDSAELWGKNRYKITEVVKGSPADSAGIIPGNYLLSVNNINLTPEVCFDEVMKNKTGKRVILTLAESEEYFNSETERENQVLTIKIRPVSRAAIWYLQRDNHIEENSKLVKELSEDKFGYIQISAMSNDELLRFKKELNKFIDKKGLVLDLRGNIGGWTAREMLEILSKEPYVLRSYQQFARISENAYRGYSWEKPIVLLIDENSVSNAEIFAEGFRQLGLGPIVGMPTEGGVIGTSSFRLSDGSSIRLPAWGAWTLDGEDLEGIGRMPDVFVKQEFYTSGIDKQLATAITELRKQVLYFEKYNVRPYRVAPREEIEPELEKLLVEYKKSKSE